MKELMQYNGRQLSYAVERIGGNEKILGKAGAITVTEDDIVIVCDGKEVFRCVTDGAVIAMLMSGNGCDIKGNDKLGVKRHLVAHFSTLK